MHRPRSSGGMYDAPREAMRIFEPNTLREAAAGLRRDISFVRTLARALGPGAARLRPHAGAVFGKPQRLDTPQLAQQRIGVVASGGSGATAAVVGVRRAFEEAGLEPAVITAASGSVLFASLWACGLSAEEIGQFWLSLFTRDYVDPSWRALVRRALHRFRGTESLLRGAAIERAFRHRIGGVRLGETRIPFAAAVHNVDAGRVELLSSRRTPELPVARVVRIAISVPTQVDPIELEDPWCADGRVVDVLPTEPLDDEDPLHLVIGTSSYVEPAPCDLGDRLELLEPVSPQDVHAAHFYESFLDRRHWRRYMLAGRASARDALMRRERTLRRHVA
jgi:NTE family protein